jgi:catechol 2,3-dioxygenase-like lactoylglutathione lyase family enzyme
MERFIADLVKDLETGRVDRRQFCETLALAATVYAAGESAANAAPARGFTMLGINHIAYNCPDYARVRDWYTSMFGMESTSGKDSGKRANLMFGPEPGKGGNFAVVRTGETTSGAKATVDHICYTISGWDEAKVRAALKAKGPSPTGRDGSLHVYDPFDYDVQIASAAGENAFRR